MKKGFLGILALTLVLGMAVVGCDDGDGNGNNGTGNGNGGPVSMEMVSIPAGTLTWGSATITLGAFKMGVYEVTQEQYRAVMGVNPSSLNSNPAAGETQNKRPVEMVTWFDAIEFCNKLSTKEGLTPVYTITGRTPATGYPIGSATVTANLGNNGYRLPTEAQWEYACRAGSTTNWYFGDTEAELVNYAWYTANSNSKTHQVGLKLPNAFGLYDMHGNVFEYCWDIYGNYPTSNQTDYTGEVSGSTHVLRGGSWYASAEGTHSSYRSYLYNASRGDSAGFRVVNGSTHIHTYSTTWLSDVSQHWKKCTGAGCDAKTETANHAPANGICITCGYDNTPVSMEMVSIPAGTLTWGSATITLSAFKMSNLQVTQEQYQEVMGVNPSYFSSNPAAGETQNKRPVEMMTWFDAIEFCNKLSTKEGLTPVYTITGRTPATGYPIASATVTANWENNGYRLPTEAQWEYACRAGSTTIWYFGDTEAELVNYAWYEENSNSRTHQVGKKLPNAFGLYDMYGNVAEWCWDWYGDYPTSSQTNYTGAVSGDYRVERGGSWYVSAGYTRSSSRVNAHPSGVGVYTGFRVVRP